MKHFVIILLASFPLAWAQDGAWATGSGASGSYHLRGEEVRVPSNNPEYRNIVDLEKKELEEKKREAWKDYSGEIKEKTNAHWGER